MIALFVDVFTTDAWWGDLVHIALFYLAAFVVHRLARLIARGPIFWSHGRSSASRASSVNRPS
jgi:hypothetical protein